MEVLDLAGLEVGMEAGVAVDMEAGVGPTVEAGEDSMAVVQWEVAGVGSMVDMEAGEDTMADTMMHSFSALAQDFGRDITGATRIIGGGPMDTMQGTLMGTMPDGLTKGRPTIQLG